MLSHKHHKNWLRVKDKYCDRIVRKSFVSTHGYSESLTKYCSEEGSSFQCLSPLGFIVLFNFIYLGIEFTNRELTVLQNSENQRSICKWLEEQAIEIVVKLFLSEQPPKDQDTVRQIYHKGYRDFCTIAEQYPVLLPSGIRNKGTLVWEFSKLISELCGFPPKSLRPILHAYNSTAIFIKELVKDDFIIKAIDYQLKGVTL